MPKLTLRERLLQQRRQMPVAAVRSLGLRIQQRVLQSPLFLDAEVVALYHPIRNEVDTELLLQAALRRRKTVVFPRVRGRRMDMVAVSGPRDLAPGAYGIMEPAGGELVGLEAIDLLVMPGVGFDRAGGRLGYGQGYYDRLLGAGRFEGALVGVCYGFQLCRELPTEAHDMPVHCIVTEKELLAIGGPVTAVCPR